MSRYHRPKRPPPDNRIYCGVHKAPTNVGWCHECGKVTPRPVGVEMALRDDRTK